MVYIAIEEVYGKWVNIKRSPDDPHIITITLSRREPIGDRVIEVINNVVNGEEVVLVVKKKKPKSPFEVAIEKELKKRKESRSK